MSRFVLQHVASGLFWKGTNTWAKHVAAARWFPSAEKAELAGLRELPDPRFDWAIRELEDDGHSVKPLVSLEDRLANTNSDIAREFDS